MAAKLIPPFRFAYVEKDLFRGAYPVTLNFEFLRTLHLKTIISLAPIHPDQKLREFCSLQHITNHFYECPKYAGQIGLSVSTITDLLLLICNENNLPLYIHSVHGGHTTGLVIMCLRKLQMWSPRATFFEFNQFVSDSCEPFEEEFYNSFTATLELRPPRPAWLKQLRGRRSHPTMNVILSEEAETDSDDEGDDADAAEKPDAPA
jgi:tyrosine-protein phosphatase OCA6